MTWHLFTAASSSRATCFRSLEQHCTVCGVCSSKRQPLTSRYNLQKSLGYFFFFCSLGIDLSSKMTERTYFIFRKARRRKLTSTRNIYCTQNCGCKLKRELFSGPSANKGNTEERTRVAFSSVSRSKCCTSKEEHCGNYIPRCGLLSIGRKAPWPFWQHFIFPALMALPHTKKGTSDCQRDCSSWQRFKIHRNELQLFRPFRL